MISEELILIGFVWQLVGFSLPGEVWGWALFYAGIAVLAFGSAYYHLKPNDSRVTWDTLPVSISISFKSFRSVQYTLFVFWFLEII